MVTAIAGFEPSITEDAGPIKTHYYPSIAAIMDQFPTPPKIQGSFVLPDSMPVVQSFYDMNSEGSRLTPPPTYSTIVSTTTAIENATEGLRADLRVKTITIKALKAMIDMRDYHIRDYEQKISALRKTGYAQDLRFGDLKNRCRNYLDRIACLEETMAGKDEEIKELKRMLKEGGVKLERRKSGAGMQWFVDKTGKKRYKSPVTMGSTFEE